MANIPLKTLTFPGTDNVYTVPYFVKVNTVLPAANWVGVVAPYSQEIVIDDVCDIKGASATPRYSSDIEANLLIREACKSISYSTFSGNIIVFVCQEDKPDIDIPVELEVRA